MIFEDKYFSHCILLTDQLTSLDCLYFLSYKQINKKYMKKERQTERKKEWKKERKKERKKDRKKERKKEREKKGKEGRKVEKMKHKSSYTFGVAVLLFYSSEI